MYNHLKHIFILLYFLNLTFASLEYKNQNGIKNNYLKDFNYFKNNNNFFNLTNENSQDFWQNYSPFYNKIYQLFSTSQNLNFSDTIHNLKYSSKNVGPACIASLEAWVEEISKIEFSEIPAFWAIKMFDAWGKIPEGILSGNLYALGDYDGCLATRGNVNNNNFKGKYCYTYFLPQFLQVGTEQANKVLKSLESPNFPIELLAFVMYPPTWGLCFPSVCSYSEIESLLYFAFDKNITLPNGMTLNLANDLIYPWPQACYTDENEINTSHHIVIVLTGIIIGLCILGTIADYIYMERKTKDSNFDQNIGIIFKFFLAWSIYSNTKRWLSTKKDGESDLGCIHGIRFLTMAWVVICHTWNSIQFENKINTFDVVKVVDGKNWTIFALLNATVSVDTFFTLSGLLISYNLLNALQKSKGKLNIPMLYLHRFIRLTPLYAFCIGMTATLLEFFENAGPWGYVLKDMAQNCQDHWWRNLLYIQNLFSYDVYSGDNMCFRLSWYLAIDMQFFFVAPLIIYPIWYKEKIGLFLWAIWTLGVGIIVPSVITSDKNLSPTFIPLEADSQQGTLDYVNYYYTKPYCRFGPYAIGILGGWILHKYRGRKLRIPKFMAICAWLFFTAVALSIIFGVKKYFTFGAEWTTFTAVVYGGLHRTAWGVVILWIVIACVKGRGWWINEFLSWNVFIPLGRLTYATYLVSFFVQLIIAIYRGRTISSYDTLLNVNLFFGHLVLSLIVAWIFSMAVEAPFMQLEKLIFRRRK